MDTQGEQGPMQDKQRPWVIAHRGVPCEAPENTLAGFEWAIQQGANWIELDVHQSSDQQLVVIHDETVDRTTDGTGPVARKTLHELQTLDAGGWKDARFRKERIPTLAEVLALTEGQAGVVIEVKAGSRQYPGIEQQIAGELRQANRLADVIIISADRDAIAMIRQLDSEIATLCFHEKLLAPETWELPSEHYIGGLRPTLFLFGDAPDLDEQIVGQAHRKGIGVLTSLVSEPAPSPEMIACLVQTGVDGIFTNEPAVLRRLLSG